MNRELKIVNSYDYKNHNSTIIILDGFDIRTKDDLYCVFKQSIDFPEYFWENWDAFWDIITDSYFISEDIYLVIKNYKDMFTDNEDKQIFFCMLLDWLQNSLLDVDIYIYICTSN